MVATKHELEIRAFVRDQATPGLQRLRGEVAKTATTTKTAAVSTGALGSAFGGLSGQLGTAIASYVGVTAAVYAAVRAFTAAARAVKDLTLESSRLAAQAEEVESAFGFVFGDLADSSRASLEQLARETGRYSVELKDAAVSFQLMLEPMTGSAELADELSRSMVQLGVDLGSLRNVAPQEALGRLQSALAGNAEALRTLVGFISEADVKQKVYAAGIVEAGKELTDQEKLYGRIAAVLERLGPAVGDAARTQGSFTNTLVATAAAIKEEMLPAGERINKAALEMFNAFGGVETITLAVRTGMRSLALVFEGATRVVITFGPVIENWIRSLAVMTAIVEDQVGKWGRLLDIVTKLDPTMRLLRAGFESINTDPPEVTDNSASFIAKIEAALAQFRAQLEASRALADAEERRTQALDFSATLAERMRSLEAQTAQTVEQRIRAETAIHTAAVARVQTQAEELGIAEKVQGSIDRYVLLMQEALKLRIDGLKMAEEERLAAEQARALQEEANRQLKDHAFAIGTLRSGVDSFASAIGSIASGAQTAQEAFKNMASNIIGDIAAMIARMAALRLAFSFANAAGFGAGFNQALGTSFVTSAKGNVFSGGNVQKFADGGIVTGPTIFPMRRGAGLMGEAGPEAVMPLKRTRSGRLGVEVSGGASSITVSPTINIVAAPGQSERAVAQAVMHQLITNPQFISAVNGAGRA